MDFSASAWPQFVQGFAVACFFMPLTTITLSGLPPERLAAASSLSNFARTLAGSIGTSITTTLWTQRESLHHAHLTESVTPYNPIAQGSYQQLMEMGMSEKQASAYIAQQITNQGLIISANEIFWAAACREHVADGPSAAIFSEGIAQRRHYAKSAGSRGVGDSHPSSGACYASGK